MSKINWAMLWVGGLALLLLLFQYSMHRRRPAQPLPQTTQTISACAPIGQQRMLTLPDGSTARLNTGSCLHGTFSFTARSIQLESSKGSFSNEAIFTVRRDPHRPFIVDTGNVSVAVLGTTFDVYTRQQFGTRVTVIEGVVQIFTRGVISQQKGVPVYADQQIDIPNQTARASLLRHVTAHDIQRTTAWTDGIIQLDGQHLKDNLVEFERYQPIVFTTTDPWILGRRLGGAFRTTDVDSFLRALRSQCIRGKYDDARQNVALTRIMGCSP